MTKELQLRGTQLDGKKKNDAQAITVEDCISRGVFGSEKNVFADFRKQGKSIVSYENPYVLSVNEQLNQPMGILIEKPFWIKMTEQNQTHGNWGFPMFPTEIVVEEREKRYKDVPMIVAPGREEEGDAVVEQCAVQCQGMLQEHQVFRALAHDLPFLHVGIEYPPLIVFFSAEAFLRPFLQAAEQPFLRDARAVEGVCELDFPVRFRHCACQVGGVFLCGQGGACQQEGQQ